MGVDKAGKAKRGCRVIHLMGAHLPDTIETNKVKHMKKTCWQMTANK